jgi:hypothetical protein
MQRRRNPPQEMTMTTRTAAMFLLITGNVLACRQAPAESPVDPAASAPYEEVLATPVPAFEVPTPQMLHARRGHLGGRLPRSHDLSRLWGVFRLVGPHPVQ